MAKRFKFGLESVLKYRKSTEDYEKNVLAGLNAKLASLVGELAVLRHEYSDKSLEFENNAIRGMKANEIKASHAFMKNIEYGIELKQHEIDEQNKRVARQTSVVVKAMQDVKTVDKLKDSEFKKYENNERKAQEKFIEEFVSYKTAVRL